MGVVEIAVGAELLKDGERLVQVTFGDRARAGDGDEAAERQVTEAGLIALAEQIEQRGALREVVIGVGGAAALRVCLAAQPQVLAPCRGRDGRVERLGGRGQPLFGVGQPPRRGERFGRD